MAATPGQYAPLIPMNQLKANLAGWLSTKYMLCQFGIPDGHHHRTEIKKGPRQKIKEEVET